MKKLFNLIIETRQKWVEIDATKATIIGPISSKIGLDLFDLNVKNYLGEFPW